MKHNPSEFPRISFFHALENPAWAQTMDLAGNVVPGSGTDGVAIVAGLARNSLQRLDEILRIESGESHDRYEAAGIDPARKAVASVSIKGPVAAFQNGALKAQMFLPQQLLVLANAIEEETARKAALQVVADVGPVMAAGFEALAYVFPGTPAMTTLRSQAGYARGAGNRAVEIQAEIEAGKQLRPGVKAPRAFRKAPAVSDWALRLNPS